ncbi:MAG: DUF2256 domain-containing protein [Methylophilaceae bacterium]|nr:DUF2256 domain-containing protein [Methylophilaceae bacterium]MDG1445264.1 DUF2256 domain-containing protein [Methylophilaceae bacterium]MDG1821379.1 DUF2256 domain-containing protein [Methylophilaceae bacterium]MDG2293565.1 DUF2256 domain-containing protein [Methylophilaceae bacterium]
MIKKGDLPVKVCVVCLRPFSWRKKWATVWDEVKYCSNACRHNKQRVIK